MTRLLLLLALFAPACRGVYAPDVARAFSQDFAEARLRFPARREKDPARAESGDMARTLELARTYLERDKGASMHARYVRALLACAHLMRGENSQARAALDGISPYREPRLTRENAAINAVLHAVAAARDMEARSALRDLYEGRMQVEDFVKRYGTFVGIDVPAPEAPGYDVLLRRAAERLRKTCFAEVAGDPHEMEVVHESRTEYHRLLGEQIYNDTASLVVELPQAQGAEGEWLRYFGVVMIINYGRIYAEIVPMRLSHDQKRWLLELADGLFRRGERAAGELKGRAIYATLPRRLRDAETEVRGWIETR